MCLRDKATETLIDHPLLSSVKYKNSWIHTSIPLYVSFSRYLAKQAVVRFTFTDVGEMQEAECELTTVGPEIFSSEPVVSLFCTSLICLASVIRSLSHK